MAYPRRPRGRRILAAKLVAEGKSQQEVAEVLGVSRQAVSKAVGAVLNYEAFEDVRNCRLIANARLDAYRVPLLEIAGITDDNRPEAKAERRRIGEPAARVAAIRALVDIEKRRAEMFGLDTPKRVEVRDPDPLESMTPEEVLAACRQLSIPVPAGLSEEVERRAVGG